MRLIPGPGCTKSESVEIDWAITEQYEKQTKWDNTRHGQWSTVNSSRLNEGLSSKFPEGYLDQQGSENV